MSSSTGSEAVERNILIASTTLTGFMALEYAWHMRFEMQVIWPQFRKSAQAKIFVIARYVGITGQIFNVCFAIRVASGIPNHPLACIAWSSYQAVTIQTLLISVELLLMLLVRKLYNNDKYSLVALLVFAGAQFAAMVVSAWMVIPGLNSSSTCIMVSSHPGQIYAGVSIVIINLCILAMILWRYFRGNWPESLRPYLKIMVRDSICTIIAVTGIFLFVALMSIGFSQSQTTVNIAFHAILFFLWFAAGRLVLGKERFLQQSQYDGELTEVDLDTLGSPEDSGDYSARPTDSQIVPAVFAAVDFESGVRTNSITDERQVDDASLSSCASTVMFMPGDGGDEDSRSEKWSNSFMTETWLEY